LIKQVRAAVPVPPVASGGAGAVGVLPVAVQAGADAVLAASLFHYGTLSIGEVRGGRAEAGLPSAELGT